ncbi:MAG: MFS transporter [Cytophagaceae bacterium]|nr:MFS transporter [Cytophagaceae bacterium]
MPNGSSARRPIVTIFLTVFLDLLGVGIIIPITAPLLIEGNELVDATMSYSQRTNLLGWLLGIFSLCQFFSAPLLGSLSDKFGRRKVLFYSLFATIFGYILFSLGIYLRNIPLLFISRGFLGAAAGNLSVVYSAIADVSDPQAKARNFGLVGAAFSLGFIVGPVMGGLLSDDSLVSWFSYATPFAFSALLATLNLVLIYLNFPETLATPNRQAVISVWTGVRNLGKGFNSETLRPIFIVVFLFTLGFSFFIQFFQVFLIKKFAWTAQQLSYYFGYVGVWGVITQGGLLRLLSKRFKPQRVIVITLFFNALAYLVFLLPQVGWQMFLVVPLLSIPQGLTFPNLSSLASNAAPPQLQGETLGIQQSVQTLAQFVVTPIGGFALGVFGVSSVLWCASAFVMLAWLVFYGLIWRRQEPSSPLAVGNQ